MNWYAAYTAIRAETKAAEGLSAIGIEAYVPMEKHDRRHARKVDTIERVIFARYLFFRAVPDDFWRVNKVEGVECIVRDAQRLAPIPSEWINEIRESERAGYFDYTEARRLANLPSFEANDPVRIIGGPFAGQLATIMAAKPGQERLDVFLQTLGRLHNWKVQVEAKDLERVEQQPVASLAVA